MLDFYINGQSMKMFSPVIAADSLNYLTAKFHFTGSDWDGYTKTAHFRKQNANPAIVYDIQLNSDDGIAESSHLNLTAGLWEVYLTGTKGTARLTGTVNIISVKESGLIDSPLHELPQSIAEQIQSNASTALLMATAVKNAADRGDYNGKDGKGFVIVGYYATLAALEAAVTEPKEGEMYGVGASAPYNIYAYDFANSAWVDNGTIQGPAGATGATGTTFTPSVDDNGNISWTNDGGKTNPTTKNIRGTTGATGATGAAGKSAYAAAVDGGYTGTEATFNTAMSAFPYHNARHLPTGADPIVVKTGNIEDGAVTAAKLSFTAAQVSAVTVTLPASGWATVGSSIAQAVAVTGVTYNNHVIISVSHASQNEYNAKGVYCTAQGLNSLSFACTSAPATDLTLKVMIVTG